MSATEPALEDILERFVLEAERTGQAVELAYLGFLISNLSPADATPENVVTLRRCFFAGAASILQMVNFVVDDKVEPTNEGIADVVKAHREVVNFFANRVRNETPAALQ